MLSKILKARVSVTTMICGFVLAEFLHIYLNNHFPHIF